MAEKILIVEDEAEMLQFLSRFFKRKGYQIHTAEGGEQAWKSIEETMYDLVICDLVMDGLSGVELLERVRASDNTLPFIIITGAGTIESAVEAIKLGAFHYITKPFKIQDAEILAKRALEYGKLHRKMNTLQLQEESSEMPRMVVGSSKVMQDLLHRVEKVADSMAPVLIQGETGTGKTLLARKIHETSSRKDGPLLTIDCGALTDTLLESELFGHVKGSFTGTITAKRGLLEEAQGGTIFLDEIAEIRPPTQVKLLRAIQEKEIKPVGGNHIIKIDVRFISATSRDLVTEVEQGSFRDELYYRLAVVPLHLPPLRERREDLTLFIDYFIKKFCKDYKKKISQIDPRVLQMLYNSSWKGNIRELANILERGVLLAEDEAITMDCLCVEPIDLIRLNGSESGEFLSLKQVVEEAESKAILRTLEATNNNRTQAARLLGISRRSLYDKLAAYGLNP
jgi:DNA-binding NtrC family response regulator